MAMTRRLALELGEFGIRVNCVAPGVIASGRLTKVMAMTEKGKGPEGPLSQIPLGRVGTVAETAALIVALCSDDTSYMTGVTVDVNGASYLACSAFPAWREKQPSRPAGPARYAQSSSRRSRPTAAM